MTMAGFDKIAIIGLGLIGSSIAHAARRGNLARQIVGFDASADVRTRAAALGFCDAVAEDAASAAADAELVFLCVPVGACGSVTEQIAPHLRAMGLYTVPDFFHVRFGGRWPRVIAALAAVLCSFTYVVAQIYGVGLIASRLTGVQVELGIMLGLGGVLLCSFLGGMRAITWTQVAQYVVLLLAFLIPVSWLAYKQLGNPLAPLVYGA